MSLSLSRLISKSITNDFSVERDPSPRNAGGGRLRDDVASDNPRFGKVTQLMPRRGRTATRKRIRGNSSKLGGYNTDNSGAARGY
ncbi:hypothetical protein MLD38_005470 [Melastoma candidum]|uniref:Uncharacterized protein n=1 Tax=Melastoma candidum TaxID=119954 RepID=A0ACB9RLP3_9MYRT|nr:hypothetical protein MLD38_005470 [Melastoma candidum]